MQDTHVGQVSVNGTDYSYDFTGGMEKVPAGVIGGRNFLSGTLFHLQGGGVGGWCADPSMLSIGSRYRPASDEDLRNAGNWTATTDINYSLVRGTKQDVYISAENKLALGYLVNEFHFSGEARGQALAHVNTKVNRALSQRYEQSRALQIANLAILMLAHNGNAPYLRTSVGVSSEAQKLVEVAKEKARDLVVEGKPVPGYVVMHWNNFEGRYSTYKNLQPIIVPGKPFEPGPGTTPQPTPTKSTTTVTETTEAPPVTTTTTAVGEPSTITETAPPTTVTGEPSTVTVTGTPEPTPTTETTTTTLEPTPSEPGTTTPDTPPTTATYKIGDFVWHDENKNGLQDEGEPGISDVTVILENAVEQEVDRTVTNAEGYYFFDVEPGSYIVNFELPDGWSVTLTEVGDDESRDSNGQSSVVTIESESNLDVDLGLIKGPGDGGDKPEITSIGEGGSITGSSVFGECVANTSTVSNPVAWLIPVGLLAILGSAVAPHLAPQINSAVAELNAQLGIDLPDFGLGGVLGDKPRALVEIEAAANAINQSLGHINPYAGQAVLGLLAVVLGISATTIAWDVCNTSGYIGSSLEDEEMGTSSTPSGNVGSSDDSDDATGSDIGSAPFEAGSSTDQEGSLGSGAAAAGEAVVS